MGQFADSFDLGTLDLRAGEARTRDLRVRIAPIELGGQRYSLPAGAADARLDVSRTVSGYALRLRFEAALAGSCMRCLTEANPTIEVEAREISQPGAGEDLHSPYLDGDELDLAAWARDALTLSLPAQVVCRPECRGLCPVCGENLNQVDPQQHQHEQAADPRWAKLREIRFE